MPRRIAIIGAGFSGTVLAVHLLRQTTGTALDLHLFERSSAMGRGLAYAAREWPYLLNVPAGRLSVDGKDPAQFLTFAQRLLPQADAEDFLPRELYGDYLEEVLRSAEHDAPPHIGLTRTWAEVTRIARVGEAFEVASADGRQMIADRVVLAVGDAAAPVTAWAGAVQDHPAYHANPWTHPRTLGAGQVALIVGSGLTMADVALSLSGQGRDAPRIVSISRHGLLPAAQTVFRAGTFPPDAGAHLVNAKSVRQLMAVVRKMVSDLARQGVDWREVVTFVRHRLPALWQGLPDVERRRFVRHVRAYWDVHRHRLPPQLSSRLESLRADGRLEVNAGRIIDLVPQGARLRVSWQPRGSGSTRAIEADAVINATGTASSVKETRDPLLKSLQAAGWVNSDALGLGLRTTPEGRCIGADGPVDRLYYLGPMLRADHWEATAAAELRDHAARMADHLTTR